MAGTQLLRFLINERLTAAAEEIFGLVERTIADYEDEAVRSKMEVIQLKQQIEQLTVLKPKVILFRAGTQSASEEILSSQQLDQLFNVNENQTHGSQQVKEEQVEWCISPHIEAHTSNDADVRHPKSEPKTDSELPPSSPAVAVNVNKSTDDEWNERDDSSSPDQSQQEDNSEDVNVRFTESEATAQSDSQLFPVITVMLNDDDEWNGKHSDTSFAEQQQAQSDTKTCHFCGKRFHRDSDLTRHIDKIHMKAKEFKCSECAKVFACRWHLDAHLRTHTGEKPHKCSFCGKSFAQRSNLNVHLRMHTGEKPYFCKSCGRMVAYSYHLKMCNGTKRRKGDKSYFCLVCGRIFPTASTLKVHKKIHEAKKVPA